MCLAVLLKCSCARSTWVTRISSSSTTTAKWYVGNPSALRMTKSSTSPAGSVASPRISSWMVMGPSGVRKRITAGLPSLIHADTVSLGSAIISVPS